MPELPEVETVRRMLVDHVVGRTIASVRLSGLKLRDPIPKSLPQRLRGRRIRDVDRHGKYLLIGLSGEMTLLSHLGMSGRWLFYPVPPRDPLPHVHARLVLTGGGELWFQDPRRFGLLRMVANQKLATDPALVARGPDPMRAPATGPQLAGWAAGARVRIKDFLLDQRRLAGIGNIYASEILYRAGIDPRRKAGALRQSEWDAIAREILAVLSEAIERMGTTFSMYRTLWNEPGSYAGELRVYDRAGEPCRRCGEPIRRIVQSQRSTFFCARCQARRAVGRPTVRGRS